MKKIIQIVCSQNNSVIALTEDGKVYERIWFDKIIENGKDRYNESTDWEKGYKWIEAVEKTEVYQKEKELHF